MKANFGRGLIILGLAAYFGFRYFQLDSAVQLAYVIVFCRAGAVEPGQPPVDALAKYHRQCGD